MALCACGCGQETPISRYTRKSRGYKVGDPQKYILGHDRHTGKIHIDAGYLYDRGVALHRATVELATGITLPPNAVIHHVNGCRNDNRPGNLVVCENPSYHALIHHREKALRECGHAGWRRCSICKQWDDPEKLSKPTSRRRSVRHKECHRRYEIDRRAKISRSLMTSTGGN